jgi:type IV pilus assembly protein PilC
MARFNYVALDARGQEATGLVEAASTNAAIAQLRQSGYFPTSVIEEAISSPDGQEARRRAARVARTTKPRAKKGIVLFQRRKVRSKVLMIFTRQLATLIDSGLPLLRSLNVLAKQERDKLMKKTIIKVADSVQSGSTFSDALALHPRVFNDLYVNMVKAGEVGGVLELVLTRLSEFQEKAAKIKNKVAAAMVYPGIVITMALSIMTFLLIFIVPRFEAIFHDLLGDKPLPPVTRFVMGASGFI